MSKYNEKHRRCKVYRGYSGTFTHYVVKVENIVTINHNEEKKNREWAITWKYLNCLEV